MDADLDTLATALYVFTDDVLKDHPDRLPPRPRVGIAPRISDAELLTVAVIQALLGYPAVMSTALSMVPVAPFFLLRNSPSTYIVTEDDVSTHVRVCQSLSFSGVLAPVATRPRDPLKRHEGMPLGGLDLPLPASGRRLALLGDVAEPLCGAVANFDRERPAGRLERDVVLHKDHSLRRCWRLLGGPARPVVAHGTVDGVTSPDAFRVDDTVVLVAADIRHHRRARRLFHGKMSGDADLYGGRL